MLTAMPVTELSLKHVCRADQTDIFAYTQACPTIPP